MMRRFFHVFLIAAAALSSGCTSEYNLATGREESLIYGVEKETKIGDAVAQSIEEQYQVVTDVDINERVQKLMGPLVAVCDRKELVYTIKVLDEDIVNAVSLPGGYIYVFKGLLDRVDNDDQLAGVIAHEIGHVTAKHSLKRLQSSYGYLLLQVLAIGSGDPQVAQGINVILTTVFLEYSRRDEFEADKLGVKYMKKAGYDAAQMIGMLELLRKEQDKTGPHPKNYFRTHPYVQERIAIVNQAITGQLDYKDYLKLMGNDLD
jgi:predicted Zn-dependent protease